MINPADFRRALPPDAVVDRWRGPGDWDFRRFDWAARAPRGRLLFQGGRGDAFEKYLESFAHWHARGWSVTSLDWRGQGGSGRVAASARVGHVESFGHYLDDLTAFWREWRDEGSGPCALVGHSMGGHLALRAMVERRIDPDAGVLVAPMLGLRAPLGQRIGLRIARFMAARGDAARPAWRANERPASIASRQKLLTHDLSRYQDERWWYGEAPETMLGPPSWQWLVEAFGSAAALAGDPRLRDMTVPLLMLVADADRLVSPRDAVAVARRLPDATLHRFGREAAHELLREADPVRNAVLARIDAFLDERLGGTTR